MTGLLRLIALLLVLLGSTVAAQQIDTKKALEDSGVLKRDVDPDTLKKAIDSSKRAREVLISDVLAMPEIPVGASGDPVLRGYVDMHTHPMSYLGFGKKAVFGLPGLEIPVPAGTRNCNEAPYAARTISDALGDDNSAHGGWGTRNRCGNYIRAAIINAMADADFRDKVSLGENFHGDHPHAGYPDFPAWPDQTSKLHQQMWWEWLKRAHEGGLRGIVALTVHSETLAKLIAGDPPFDDKSVANEQISATHSWVRWVRSQNDFMEIALSSADMRRIVGEGKLAVVIGMEVDRLGNFGFGSNPSREQVTAELRRLHRAGVRYVFPIHLIDNAFGGAAVYDPFFNLVNHDLNGAYFRVATSPDRAVRHDARVLSNIPGVGGMMAAGPGGATTVVGVARGLLEGIGRIPLPPLTCKGPLPAQINDCDEYDYMKNVFTLDPSWENYNAIARGHVNARGLTSIGEHAVREMMRLGMIIDLDHMSQRAQTRAVEIAESISGGYPLVFGHNEIREDGGHGASERSAPASLVRRVVDMGGMIGVGSSDATPTSFISDYQIAAEHAQGRAAIGTDAVGFEPLPKSSVECRESGRYGDLATNFYARFRAETGIRDMSEVQGSSRRWNYFAECGVAHYGMMPEFLFDVANNDGGSEVVNNLMQSAAIFIDMWERAEAASMAMRR